MKPYLLLLLIGFLSSQISAQDKEANQVFWESLTKHCGKSYEGIVTTPISENDPFAGKKLVMHVVDCGEGFIHIDERRLPQRTHLAVHAAHPHIRRGLEAPAVVAVGIVGVRQRHAAACQQGHGH